jgi:hypothetical protein
MASDSRRHPLLADEQDYVRRGKGRKDQVGRTGIYPASAVDAPDNAEVRGQDELGHRSPGQEALTIVDHEEDAGRNEQ